MRRPNLALAAFLAVLPAGPAPAFDSLLPLLEDGPASPADWHPGYAPVCLAPEETPATPEEKRLAALLARIADLSDGTDPLVALLAETGTLVCLDDRPMEARGFYEPAAGIIVLAARLPDDLLFPIAVHELRHLDQYWRGFCPSTAFAREESVRLLFAMEADAQAIATLYAWHARERGDPGPWSELEALPNYLDITQSFAAEMAASGDPSIATAMAFDAWYAAEWRTESYYRAACAGYYDAIDREKALPSYAPLPEDYFDRFCLLPDGGAYDCRVRPRPEP